MTVCANCGQDNPEGFRFCGACAAPLDAGAPPAREVRKTVTVLFSDVAGSTALGERLDPESLRRVMSRYFDEMAAVLERHGGTVEKFIGDAIMAVFGVPVLHEDDALRACRAACDMRKRLTAVNAELERDHRVRIEQRTGVNTGEVVTGDSVQGQRLATGDAVNVAARLEQAAGPGEILIGETTRALCRDAVEVELVAPIKAKGKSEPVTAWRLQAVIEGADAISRHLESPLVGRSRELDALRQAFERAASERACHLFTVLGPAGVGKSRLVLELVDELGDRALVLEGRCLPYGEGITYWPLGEVFRSADAEDELDAALTATSSGEIAWAVRKIFERWAAERPVVLVLDDLHWAEPTFLDLVEHVADGSRDSPILLVCMARPELLDARSTWAGGKLNATTVLLEPLSEAETETLIENLASGADLDERAEARIVEASEGNPLFVEEMLAMLSDEGFVGGEIEAPPTIQALLAARLDRLPPRERGVVERGAVEGRVFHVGAVAELAPPEHREVREPLQALVRKELIRPARGELAGDDAFRFRHLLIRDAAYEGLPKEVRAELHERLADWLERKVGDEHAEGLEEVVGYHFEQAHRYRLELGPPDDHAREIASRAAAMLGGAGRRAQRRGDAPAAVSLLERAVALLPQDEAARRALLPRLGYQLAQVGRLPEAEAVLDEAVELARLAHDQPGEDDAVIERLDVLVLSDPEGRVEEARREINMRLPRLEAQGDDHTLARAWAVLGTVGNIELDYAAMERAWGRVRVHADRLGAYRLADEAAGWLAFALNHGPTPASEVLAQVEALPPPRSEFGRALIGFFRTESIAMVGRLDEARAEAPAFRALFRELGHELWWGGSSMHEAWLALDAGDPATAERVAREGCEALRSAGDRSYLSTVAAVLAEALVDLGRIDEAEEWTLVSEETGSSEDLATQFGWRSQRARVLARRGAAVQAELLARDALALVEASAAGRPGIPWLGDVLLAEADVLRVIGKEDEAREAAERALETYELKGHVPKIAKARAFLGLGAGA